MFKKILLLSKGMKWKFLLFQIQVNKYLSCLEYVHHYHIAKFFLREYFLCSFLEHLTILDLHKTSF